MLYRSFCGPPKWVISLPVLASILLLMSHPGKTIEGSPLPEECPDRDFSWCLDSLQGFCRLRGPEEGPKTLSSRFGTYPDSWMYLNFIMHHFGPAEEIDLEAKWQGDGIRAERRRFSFPIGQNGKEVVFLEERVWTSLRTAIGHDKLDVDSNNVRRPTTVGLVLSDFGHQSVDITPKTWAQRGLASVPEAEGVVFFQMLIWSATDDWGKSWASCLDYIDSLHEPEVSPLRTCCLWFLFVPPPASPLFLSSPSHLKNWHLTVLRSESYRICRRFLKSG